MKPATLFESIGALIVGALIPSNPASAQTCIPASTAECAAVRAELPKLQANLAGFQKLLKDCTDHLGSCTPGKVTDLQTSISIASDEITCDRQKLLFCNGVKPPAAQPWTVSEFQPDVPNGGRANTISVHPTDNKQMIVASETGGLFR